MINALKKIEIEEMSISKFMGLTELLSIQYLTNISPLTPKRLCRNWGKGERILFRPFGPPSYYNTVSTYLPPPPVFGLECAHVCYVSCTYVPSGRFISGHSGVKWRQMRPGPNKLEHGESSPAPVLPTIGMLKNCSINPRIGSLLYKGYCLGEKP